MVRPGRLAQDSITTIAAGLEEVAFLASIPWVIDAGTQEQEPLCRALTFEAAQLADLPVQPTFALIVMLAGADGHLVRELILSVRCQTWTQWELLLVGADPASIAHEWAQRDVRIRYLRLDQDDQGLAAARNAAVRQSSADFIAFLAPNAVLHPSALGTFARHWNCQPAVNLIYANEAVLDARSRQVSDYLAKPLFDPFTLLRFDYIGSLTAIHRNLLLAARRDGQVCRTGYDGVEDHELALRLAATGQVRPLHLPLHLCYQRSATLAPGSDPVLAARRLRLVTEMASEFYPGATVAVQAPGAGGLGTAPSVQIRAIAGRAPATLLIVIPFRDHVDQTLLCLESIERQDHHLDVTVVLVDNGSVASETRRQLDLWLAQSRTNRYLLIEYTGAFNYARINNTAVRRFGAGADLILWLNNDVELLSTHCFGTMANQLLADERAGVIGIRLMYPGGQEVQHGGVKVTHHLIGSGYYVIGHSVAADEFVGDERITFGVTFACAMIRRSLFDRLGGLEEILMPNAFGDVDFCARAVEAGFRNYYFGTLVGLHGESKSRGRATEEIEFTTLQHRHAQTFADWRLRVLAWRRVPTWPLVAVAPPTADRGLDPIPPPLPLRYLVVDRANEALKRALGPLHRVLRRGLVLASRRLRRSRSRPGAADTSGISDPVIRRPFLFRRAGSRRT